jgi:hypothetical protein
VYPNQPRAQNQWPAQPPQHTAGRADRPGYDQGGLLYDRDGSGDPRRLSRYGRPRRRRRGGWILLITLAVPAVLAVIADQVAKSYAQNTIASNIQKSSGMSVKPSVSIEGFPFLTQLAARDLRVIDISATNVPAGKITVTSIKAKATGVHISSGFNSATVDQINGTAFITFASLAKALGLHGVASIGADPADGPNAVKLTAGSIGAITGKIELSGPNQVTVHMGSLSGLASLLGGAVPVPSQTFQIPKLPAGLVVRSVSVTDQGIVGTATAQHTMLSQ